MTGERLTDERAPCLSIVVVALLGGDATRRLLDALGSATHICDYEIVVTGTAPGEAHPGVHWLATPEDASVPLRRSLGAARAAGDIVAFLEDTVVPHPGWGEAVCALHTRHPNAQAIGGTLRLDAGLAPRALALALLDAGRFATGEQTSETASALPGCNMSFKRGALERLGALSGAPLREAEAIPELARESRAVRLESDMAVTWVATDWRGQRPGSRFQHGRLYAGHRGGALRALLAPMLPFALLYRCWRSAARAGVQRPGPALAHAFGLACAWSLGEAAGYLFGPGDAERHWR